MHSHGSSRPSRRDFIRLGVMGAAAFSAKPLLGETGPSGNGRIRREIFVPSPRAGATVLASTFYTRPTGTRLIAIQEIFTRSDTVDVATFRYSDDNGRTWRNGEEFPTFGLRPTGKLRRAMRACTVDPVTGRLLHFFCEAILPNDDPLEGFREWTVRYRVSEDDGYTWYLNEQVIHQGLGYNSTRPLPGVQCGHNCYMVGDTSSQPIWLADGTLLVPIIISPTGSDGNYFNPGGGYTYCDAAVLRGRWSADGRHVEWQLSQRVIANPNLSTRGMDEPTLGILSDGRVLMVLRGSNEKKPSLPGRRWVAYSADHGRTWTTPRPWTYTDGRDFYSPASSSQLVAHSSGRLFWLGNIVPENPTGNRPRYPFVIAEVNRRTGLLIEKSVRTIDTRAPNESALVALASGSSREDRETGEIVLNLTRWGEHSTGDAMADYNWTANAYIYRIPVT